MKLTIDLLKNHPESIPRLVEVWHEVLGKLWVPDIQVKEIESWFYEWLNDEIPLAYVALYDGSPVGSCSLQLNDGVRPDLIPWLGDLIVDPKYQKLGIGKMLVNSTKNKAKELGYDKLYLFTFDPTLPGTYYTKLGWKIIGTDVFKGQPVTVMELS